MTEAEQGTPATKADTASPSTAGAPDARAVLSAEQLRTRMPSGWRGDTAAIWREWTFDTYLDGVQFAERVAQQAESVQHHPDLLITFRRVRVTYSTHDAGGVTALDVSEAASIRELR